MQCPSLFWLLLNLTGGSAAYVVATDQVPLLGPSFISNFDNSESQAINEARSEFPNVIESLFSSGDLNRTDLIFGVDVFSASTNDSIYSYYHVGEGQEYALTAGRLDDRTISRVGSVSKLFTAYAIIAQAGIEVFSHPVTRYLPELAGNATRNASQTIEWSDITVGALLSQQAGSGGPAGMLSERSDALSRPRKLTGFAVFIQDIAEETVQPTPEGMIGIFKPSTKCINQHCDRISQVYEGCAAPSDSTLSDTCVLRCWLPRPGRGTRPAFRNQQL